MTYYGGSTAFCYWGCGTAFKVSSTGDLTTLYSFCIEANCADGLYSEGPLVQATDGNYYGTTSDTVFKLTQGGELTTLVGFDMTNGSSPYAGVTQDTNGAFYGTTYGGGTSGACYAVGCGTVFTLSLHLGPFVETLPSSGKAGTAVKILGTDLIGATSVTFNGTPATFKVVSASEITTAVPSGATTGTVQVTLPTKTLSSNVPFYIAE